MPTPLDTTPEVPTQRDTAKTTSVTELAAPLASASRSVDKRLSFTVSVLVRIPLGGFSDIGRCRKFRWLNLILISVQW
jgi:hypothetical protein